MKNGSFPATLAVMIAPILVSPAPAQELDDAVIAHVAVTANQLDVIAAEQALEKTSHPEVRSFAETMIRDHQGVIAQAAALAERLGVTPRDNPTSRSLASDAESARERLGQLTGAEFDRAYMDQEVAYHEAVITAVGETLVPATNNGELRALLESVLPALEAHLEHARQVRAELGDR